VELFDYSLWAAPVGLAIGTVELIWHRRVLPLLLGLAAVPLGGVVGRVAWEWFANPPTGFDFGSEFEGYDWVVGFASIGGLVGTIAGAWLSARKTAGTVRSQSSATLGSRSPPRLRMRNVVRDREGAGTQVGAPTWGHPLGGGGACRA
jgi:hypothetical protein